MRHSSAFVALAALLVLLSLGTAGYGFYLRFQETALRRAQQVQFNARIEQVGKENREALRAVLCLARAAALRSTDLTPAQRVRTIRFYRGALALIHAGPCQ